MYLSSWEEVVVVFDNFDIVFNWVLKVFFDDLIILECLVML